MKRKARKVVTIVLALLLVALVPLESYAASSTVTFEASNGVVYARKASKVFRNISKTKKNLKYIRWCLNRGMFEDESNGLKNKEVKRKRFISDIYDIWGPAIELVHYSGGQFYGDLHGTATGTTTVWSSSGSSNNSVLYDNSGKAYYYESSTGRYRASDGTYYDVAAYYGSSSRSRRSRNNYNEAWEWALEIGIVYSGESPDSALQYGWAYDVLDDLAYYIDGIGGYKDLGWSHKNRYPKEMKRLDECRLFYLVGNCDGGIYDPDDIAYYSLRR